MFRSIQTTVIASFVTVASLVICQMSLAVEAAGGNGVRGVRLLEPEGNTSYPVPSTPSTATPGPPVENLLATPQYYSPAPQQRLHAIWTVTVYARNASGQTQTGTYHVSSHTWDGAKWVPNPSAMEQLNQEIRSLPSRGWYAYNWAWQQYGICVGN